MVAALIALGVVVVVIVWWATRKTTQRTGATPSRHLTPATPAPSTGATARTAATGPDTSILVPPAPVRSDAPLVLDPRLVRVETLSDTRKLALLEALRSIPRPPRGLHQLVAPEFLGRASSAELSELVMSEPVVAARVMAAVNSPLYGLRQTVTSVGQAITFLGLNTVRSLCLQYMLSEALAPGDVQLRKEFDTLWRASAIASELCLQLAKRLQLADAAGMATQLVLSFLGRFAAATLARPEAQSAAGAPAALPAGAGMLQRALAEQDKLGLSAGEMGYLLMQEWGLPETMVVETRGIGRILFTAAPAPDPAHAARMALSSLSAGLAERIARRQLTHLADYDPATDDSEDLAALRPHLAPALLAQVADTLRAPEMVRVLA